jgi:hypothetical protein
MRGARIAVVVPGADPVVFDTVTHKLQYLLPRGSTPLGGRQRRR